MKKMGKKIGNDGGQWKTKKDPGIPNDWPFKSQLLSAMEQQKEAEKEAQERNKQLRKLAAEKKKAEATKASTAAAGQSILPRGMGAPVPMSSSASNAIQLDAYTRRVWREVKQVVEESDLILEVLDARDPLGSRCFEMESWVYGKLAEKEAKRSGGGGSGDASTPPPKPILLVLTKTDLVPPSVTAAWIEFFTKHDQFPTIAFWTQKELEDSKKKGVEVSPKELCPGAETIMQLISNFQSSTKSNEDGTSSKPVKVGIIGYANVGKSSVLNTLARTHATGVGHLPGFTKELFRYRLSKGLYAIDTPGIPTKDDARGPHIHLPISEAKPIDDLANFLQHVDVENLQSVLQLPAFEDMKSLMDLLAQRTGRFMKGGELNHMLAARKLLKDFNAGKIPFFTLLPDMGDDEEEEEEEEQSSSKKGKGAVAASKSNKKKKKADDEQSLSPIQQFFVQSNRRSLSQLKKRQDIPPESAFLEIDGSIFEHPDDNQDDEDYDDDDDDGEEEEEGDDEDDEDEEMQDGEEDDENEDEEMDDGEDDEDDGEEEADDDSEWEEEEEVAPSPKRKGKANGTRSSPSRAAASPSPSKKKGKASTSAITADSAPTPPNPATPSKSKSKSKTRAAATPAPAPAPALATPTRSNRKRSAPQPAEEAEAEADVEAEEVQDEPSASIPARTPTRSSKRQAALAAANAMKPTPKPVRQTRASASTASSKKGKKTTK